MKLISANISRLSISFNCTLTIWKSHARVWRKNKPKCMSSIKHSWRNWGEINRSWETSLSKKTLCYKITSRSSNRKNCCSSNSSSLSRTTGNKKRPKFVNLRKSWNPKKSLCSVPIKAKHPRQHRPLPPPKPNLLPPRWPVPKRKSWRFLLVRCFSNSWSWLKYRSRRCPLLARGLILEPNGSRPSLAW